MCTLLINYRNSVWKWIFALLLLLFVQAGGLYAQELDLPSMGLDPYTEHNSANQPAADRFERSLQGRKNFEKALKRLTRRQITEDSTMALHNDGVTLETYYGRGDISTVVESDGDSEVTFTFKISF